MVINPILLFRIFGVIGVCCIFYQDSEYCSAGDIILGKLSKYKYGKFLLTMFGLRSLIDKYEEVITNPQHPKQCST